MWPLTHSCLWCVIPVAWVFALVGLAATGVGAQRPEFSPRVVIPFAFPPIKNAPTVSAAEADRLLGEAELVLGVTINDQSRAYPINMLTGPRREIVNDRLGGRAITATW